MVPRSQRKKISMVPVEFLVRHGDLDCGMLHQLNRTSNKQIRG